MLVASLGFASSISGTARGADESAETEALLRKGIQLRRQGQDEAALNAFLEAEVQSPNSVRVLLHVATAAQAASKWLMADEYLQKATARENDEYYQRYKGDIDEVKAAVAQRVGHFRAVGTPDGAEVILNGQPVGTLPMDTPKTLEAGTYVLEVNKVGFYRLRRPITVPGVVLTRETVELRERLPGSPDDGSGGVVGADGTTAQKDWWSQPWVTWTFAGLGVAGLATSGVALLLRNQAVDHWNDDNRCLDPERPGQSRSEVCADVRNDIDTAEQVAMVGGVVGGVFLTAALTHWLATRGSDEPPSTASGGSKKAAEALSCNAGWLSVACSGSF
jgi:hypothetical protein